MSEIDTAWDALRSQVLSDEQVMALARNDENKQVVIAIWGPKPWPKPGSIRDGEVRVIDPAVLKTYKRHADGWRVEAP